MTSLDYYTIEELLTETSVRHTIGERRFVQEEVLHKIVVWESAPQSCN
jgi:hypothetical protein